MKILETPHKKKSAILTAICAALILLLFFVLGLTYYDPPISYGMEVNFGTLAQGSGAVQPERAVASQPEVVQEKQVQEKQQVTPPPVSTHKNTADVLTEKESTIAVPEKKQKVEQIQPEKKNTRKTRRISSRKNNP